MVDGPVRLGVWDRSVSARRAGLLAAALGALALPDVAFAQTQQELATRRILIDRATAARTAGDHAQALTLAQSAGALRMTPSVRLFIAQELDAIGDPAGALGLAGECVREVERDLTVPHRAELLTTCRELESATRARIGYLVVHAPEPVPEGLRVTVRGAALNLALLGVPNVLSPGSVAIEARAPGRSPFSAIRDVTTGTTLDVALDLPAIVAATPAIVAAPVLTPPVTVAAPLRTTPATRTRSRLAPALLLGGGVAALVGGAVLLAVRADVLDPCIVDGSAVECFTLEDLDAARGANGLAAGAGVLLGVGVAAVGVGTIWLLTGRASTRPAQWTASVASSRGAVTFELSGRLP